MFGKDGRGHALYSECIDLHALGRLRIRRASRVEFNNLRQCWEVHGLDGRVLFSSASRETCLDWERKHYRRLLKAGKEGENNEVCA